MSTFINAREAAMECALKGMDAEQIIQSLDQQGLGGSLSQEEVECLVIEARTAMNVMPHRPGRLLPRVIGCCAIILGAAALWLGSDWPRMLHRYSPSGCGLLALVLGIILVIKPVSSREDL